MASRKELEMELAQLRKERDELKAAQQQTSVAVAEKPVVAKKADPALRMAARNGKKLNNAKLMAALARRGSTAEQMMGIYYDAKVKHLQDKAKAIVPTKTASNGKKPLDYGTYTKAEILAKLPVGVQLSTPDVHRLFNPACCHKMGWVGQSSVPQGLHELKANGDVALERVGGTNYWTRLA